MEKGYWVGIYDCAEPHGDDFFGVVCAALGEVVEGEVVGGGMAVSHYCSNEYINIGEGREDS